MRTYLTIWFNSEGASPMEIKKSLETIGFKATHGNYDFFFDWAEEATVNDLLKLGDSIQNLLRGSQAMFKMETI